MKGNEICEQAKMKKKEAFQKTRIVIRHLPPSLSQSNLFSQFDHLFSHRYNWFCFRPGKPSQKQQRYSRAYIDFKSTADVLEFAEFFDGHVFVNEKGAQFKATVEYAPSQRVPKSCRKDSREGTIYKDPDYLEFIKLIAKPTENLPSAEIQLERKEAEQSGTEKETPIATPLMEFVRQRRAAEALTQGSSPTLKIRKRGEPTSLSNRGAGTMKRRSNKKKYIPKESTKNMNRKAILNAAPRHEDHLATSRGKQVSEVKSTSRVEGSNLKNTLKADSVMKKILLRGKEHEISPMPESMLQSSVSLGNTPVSTSPKVNQRLKTGGKLIRSVLNNEAHQNKSSTASQVQQKLRNSSVENDKRQPQAMDALGGLVGPVSYIECDTVISDDGKRLSDDKFMKRSRHGLGFNGKEKHVRNKDIPSHGEQGLKVSLLQDDVKHSNEEHVSSTLLQYTKLHSDSSGVTHPKDDMDYGNNNGEATRASKESYSSVEYGSHMKFSHRGKAHYNTKEDVPLKMNRGRPSRRGTAISHTASEKQVWVQKSTSGS